MHLTSKQANDKDFIRHLAEQAFTQPVTSLERLAGVMAYNYEINHRYIFKLPSSKINPDDWLRQSQYMRVLQDNLSYQIPQPVVTTVYDTDKQPFISSSYKKIDGHCIKDTQVFSLKSQHFKIRYFEQLSEAVQQIHSFSPDKLPFELPTKQEILEKYFFKRLNIQPSYYQKKIFQKLTHSPIFGLGKSADKTNVLTHSDLHCGNVVLNDQNKLVGLLDFDTLGRSDYFWEFRPLLYSNPDDISLFKTIYTRQTGIQIKPQDIDRINQLKTTLRCLGIVYAIYSKLPPKKKHQVSNQTTSILSDLKTKQR